MQNTTIQRTLSGRAAIEVNQVLRNTYLLLSLTLLFSAGSAWYAMSINAQPVGFIMLLVGMFGLSWLTTSLKDSIWGIAAIFAYTGFMGYVIGPILNHYIHNFSNGTEIVMTSLGATGIIFLGLSVHALSSRKNYSYLGGFITVGILAAFIIGIGAAIFHIPMLQLIISGAFALFSSAYILYITSSIIHGGERNYIMATISLYVAIFNLFLSLLRILSFFSGGGSSRN